MCSCCPASKKEDGLLQCLGFFSWLQSSLNLHYYGKVRASVKNQLAGFKMLDRKTFEALECLISY